MSKHKHRHPRSHKAAKPTAENVLRSPGYAEAFRSYLRKGQRELRAQARNILMEGLDDAGGFLVPEELLTGYHKAPTVMEKIRNSILRVLGREIPPSRWIPGILDKRPSRTFVTDRVIRENPE